MIFKKLLMVFMYVEACFLMVQSEFVSYSRQELNPISQPECDL